MTKSISVKIDDETYNQMKLREDINWSGVVRGSIRQTLTNIQFQPVDKERMQRALEDAARLRPLLKGGRTGTEIIREWRDRRQ